MKLQDRVTVNYHGYLYTGYISGISRATRFNNQTRYDIRVSEGDSTNVMILNISANLITPIEEPEEETTAIAGNGWAQIITHPRKPQLVKS